MTDNPAPYRSNQSVPQRVDAAWRKGYEAGLKSRRIILGTAAVLALWDYGKRHRIHWSWIIVAMLVALPVVGLWWSWETILRRRRDAKAEKVRSSTTLGRVQLDDGSWF